MTTKEIIRGIFELGLIAAIDDTAIDYDAEIIKIKKDIG